MRIAHVTDFYLPRLGGIEIQVSDLASRQIRLGHDVTIVTSSNGDSEPDPVAGPTVLRLRENPGPSPVLAVRAPFTGARTLMEGKYDVAHVHVGVGSPLGFWAAQAAVRAGLPTVVTVHSMWTWLHPLFRTLDAAGGWSRRPLRWTAVSEAAARPVRRLVGDAAVVTVLPNGIDPQDWVVDRIPRPADDVMLVAVMRLARRKRALPLLRMVREVRRRVPADVAIRLVVAGDGPERSMLQRYLHRHRMTGWVTLAGRLPRERIHDLYRRADVFVAPADLESFGIAALEARCAGVPVVAKAATGIAEFVRHGRDGLLVDSDSEQVAALVRLCKDPALRASLTGVAGVSPVAWDSTLALTADAYREAAELLIPPARWTP